MDAESLVHHGELRDAGCGDCDVSERLSCKETVFNLVNTVVGIGVVSVPYAFRLTGYSSMLLVLLLIFVTSKTALLLGSSLNLAARSDKAKDTPRKARDFSFLAHTAFGERGSAVIGVVTCLELWFALVTFMVMAGVNAKLVLPSIGAVPTIIGGCCLASAMVFLPARTYSYVSLISSLSLAVGMAAMVGAALKMPSWETPDSPGAVLRIWNAPRSVGIIAFCFAGHPCFPTVYESMEDRRSWPTSIAATFFLAFLYYGGLGVFGFLVFGRDLEASFTENVAEIAHSLLWRSAASLAFMVKIQLTAPVLLNAVMVSVCPPQGSSEWPLRRVLVLLGMTVLTALVAVAFADDVAVVASFTGSLFVMITSVIFPTLVHMRLAYLFGERGEGQWRAFVPHCLIMGFGVSMAVAGTAMAVSDKLAL